jgi:quinol monooxygenase YgiN
MITVRFSMTVRPDAEAQSRTVASDLTRTSRAEDDGCIAYTFLQQADSPLQYVLFEQWRDQDALNAHVARLRDVMGPADTDEALPATHFRRRLPKAFLDLFEHADVKRYEPVE